LVHLRPLRPPLEEAVSEVLEFRGLCSVSVANADGSEYQGPPLQITLGSLIGMIEPCRDKGCEHIGTRLVPTHNGATIYWRSLAEHRREP
jgi:hypothetical protein